MKSLNLKLKSLEGKRGFALLISIIISTIILTIGLSIINAAIKEVILASTIRQSIVALYAADTGIECGLYWDNIRGNPKKHSAFSPAVPPVVPAVPSVIECMGIIKTLPIVAHGPPYQERIELEDKDRPGDVCALLIVDISGSPSPASGGGGAKSGIERRTITSWGYNNCNPASQRRVDRALEVKYSKMWTLP